MSQRSKTTFKPSFYWSCSVGHPAYAKFKSSKYFLIKMKIIVQKTKSMYFMILLWLCLNDNLSAPPPLNYLVRFAQI